MQDVDQMTIGFCLDFIDEFIEREKPKEEPKTRKAQQSDFDFF